MIVNPDQTVGLRIYSTLGLSDQDQIVWPDLFTNLSQTLWLRLKCLAKLIHYPININLKRTWPCLKGMDQVTIICMGLLFQFFMPSFLFFSFSLSFSFLFSLSFYLQNEKSFVNKKYQRQIISQSPVDPITYRVITATPLGDGTCPVK